jgi:hypothetical protein
LYSQQLTKDIDQHIRELRAEVGLLENARLALTNGHAPKRRGRPPKKRRRATVKS